MPRQILAILLLASLPYLSACSPDKTPAEHINSAREYIAQPDGAAAAEIELKNALQIQADNFEARQLLGALYFDNGGFANAAKELEKAHELGGDDALVLPQLAQSLLETREWESLQALDTSTLTATPQALSTVLAAQGLGELHQGWPEDASDLIARAVQADPESAYALTAKAKLLAAPPTRDPVASRDVLNQVFELQSNYAPAWQFLGDLELGSGNTEQAEQAYGRALEGQFWDLDLRYKRALSRLLLLDFEGARQDTLELAKRSPDNAGTKYLQGMLAFQDGKLKEATDALDIARQYPNQYPMADFYLATAQMRLENISQAEAAAQRFLSKSPNNIGGIKLLASIKLKTGEYNEAELLLRPLSGNRSDGDAMNLLAAALLGQGRAEEAIPLLTDIQRQDPQSATAHFKLGIGLLATSARDSGMAHIETALELDPKFELAATSLATAYLRSGNQQAAIDVAQKLVRDYPESPGPENLLAKIYMDSGSETEAKAAYERAVAIAPENITAHQGLAALAIRDENLEKAREHYDTILSENPSQLETLVLIAALDKRQDDTDAMITHLELAIKEHPQEARPRIVLARYYLISDKPDRVAQTFIGLDGTQRRNPDVVNAMGLAQLQLSEFIDAKATFESLIERIPTAPQPHYNLGLAHEGLREIVEAKNEYTKALEISPDYVDPRLRLAQIQLAQSDREGFMASIGILKDIAPDNVNAILMDASRARLDGDMDQALRLYTTAFDIFPSTATMLALARQHWAMSNSASTQTVMSDWVKSHPDDIEARLQLANLYTTLDLNDQAIADYRAVLKLDSEHPVALNNLAWLIQDLNPRQALTYARRATELYPSSAAAMDTLAMVQFKNDDYKKAQRTIYKALELSPESSSLLFHAAMIDAAAGDPQKAKKSLQALIANGGDFKEKEVAEAFLEKLELNSR